MVTQICKICEVDKPLTNEHYHKSSHSTGFHTHCKICRANKNKQELKDPSTKRFWYNRLANIKQRCNNPNHKNFKNYGGRGIKCKINDWEQLKFIMGPPPNNDSSYQVDRIDNDGHYEQGNLRWATNKQNSRKRRGVVLNKSMVEDIKKMIGLGYSQRKIAKMFNVSKGSISDINTGKNWQ